MRQRSALSLFIFVRSCASFLLGGCVASTVQSRQRATVRALEVVGVGQEETRRRLVILVDAITTANWRDQPDIALQLMFEQNDITSDMPNLQTGPGVSSGTPSHGGE